MNVFNLLNVFVFVCLPGSPPAAVRRRGCDEALRQSHRQRQPAHLSAQQEILREIKRQEKEQRATDTEMKQNLGAALTPALTAPLISAYANLCALFLLFFFLNKYIRCISMCPFVQVFHASHCIAAAKSDLYFLLELF